MKTNNNYNRYNERGNSMKELAEDILSQKKRIELVERVQMQK